MEDVSDDVSEVEQDPATLGTTLSAQGFCPGLEHFLFDLAGDGLHVSLVASRHEKENVGQREGSGYVERNEILPLLGVSGEGRNGEKFAGARSGSHMILCGREVGKGGVSENVEGESGHQQSDNDDGKR
jgi:hypothetical protein